MTIIDKKTKFKDVQPGDTFFWENWYFLKFSSAGIETGRANAVCLTDGLPEDFEEDDLVTLVEATLTIS